MSEHRVFYRRHLPHWQPAGATLSVTFRLAGSLPGSVILELQADRDERERQLARISDPEQRQQKARERTLARELEWIRMSPKARQAKSKARIKAPSAALISSSSGSTRS